VETGKPPPAPMDPVDLVFPNARTVPEIRKESPENPKREREVGATSLSWFETSQEDRSPHVPGFDRR
jgi:hypothetical protein